VRFPAAELTVLREIGALAGLVAIAGLAVLGGLYVAHARDVRRLREWAGRAPERAAPARRRRPARHRPRRLDPRYGVAAIAGALVLGGLVAHQLTGNGDASDGHAAPDRPAHRAPAVRPADVTVAVLNATTVPGLAASLRDRLAAAGFRAGPINDFADHLNASAVQYAPGHRDEAAAVGRELRISRRVPVVADARALAGEAPVVVIAGADQAP
jgi:hypothetical protein